MTTRSYHGRCHCGALHYDLTSAPITEGVRCNCSICVRKGSVMSAVYYPPSAFTRLEGVASLTRYVWGDRMVNNYFCQVCGIYVFHEAVAAPGHYRINVGCLDEVDPLALTVQLIDGRSY